MSGALVISLDFELHWGIRDHAPATPQVVADLNASRSMVTTLARLFAEREVRATWATVGLLFAANAREAAAYIPPPPLRPAYGRPELDAYKEIIGATEEEDPLHLAGSLVDELCRVPGQEIASHTFSHFYCLERGADPEAFRADLAAAQAVAKGKGLRLRSVVLPRNQWRDDYAPVLLETGFDCYRGPQPGWANRPRRGEDTGLLVRASRFATTFAGRDLASFAWDEVLEPSGLCNIPATTFLRPVSRQTRVLQPLQEARVLRVVREAARFGRIAHLWWHPQNFVTHPQQNLQCLNRLLDELDRLRVSDGMRSLAMGEVSQAAREQRTAA